MNCRMRVCHLAVPSSRMSASSLVASVENGLPSSLRVAAGLNLSAACTILSYAGSPLSRSGLPNASTEWHTCAMCHGQAVQVYCVCESLGKNSKKDAQHYGLPIGYHDQVQKRGVEVLNEVCPIS